MKSKHTAKHIVNQSKKQHSINKASGEKHRIQDELAGEGARERAQQSRGLWTPAEGPKLGT